MQPVAHVSIVMPTLNQAAYLRTAIESIVTQTRDFGLECIVIDGGSNDGTLDVLRGYGTAIRWVSESDSGQSDGLNKGLRLATGDILGWLNSDDTYEPGALQRVVDVFRREPAVQWIYGRVRIVDEEGREIRKLVTAYKNLRMSRFRLERLLVENWISQMGVFWRRSAWQDAGPFRCDLHLAMDYDYWLRLGARSPGDMCPSTSADFRWYTQSKSGSQFREQFAEELRVAREHANGEHPFLLAMHRLQMVRTVAAYRLLQAAGSSLRPSCFERASPGSVGPRNA